MDLKDIKFNVKDGGVLSFQIHKLQEDMKKFLKGLLKEALESQFLVIDKKYKQIQEEILEIKDQNDDIRNDVLAAFKQLCECVIQLHERKVPGGSRKSRRKNREINQQIIQTDKDEEEIVKILETEQANYTLRAQNIEEDKEKVLPEVMKESSMGFLVIQQCEVDVEVDEILRLNMSDVRRYKFPREEEHGRSGKKSHQLRDILSTALSIQHLKTSLIGMQMLLEACVEIKVLKVEWKEGKDLYGNTEFANLFLAKSRPKSQYYTMKFLSEIIYGSLQYLPEAVRDGKPQILSIYGISSNELYGALYRHSRSKISSKIFPAKTHIGSSGGLAKEFISKYSNCTVTLFDLPEVMEISKKYNAFSDGSQITFHEGDFFKDPIPEADLYLLSRVLINWNDEKCIQLLTKVFTACKPGAGVLVMEPTVDEEIAGSFPAHMYAMIALLLTRGKLQKPSELCMLFNTTGFKDIQFKKGNVFDVILARK
ncbi:acetylserotonin O-methyltransferase-like [Ahaetulla prasina]|uniref:acetylserotonin O-methyltransferase-like n=1 Tax=Ahaetulla prasina TaxID=499056 RepID=UPI00264A1B90|nr:acetylserotonin O-methyltransferase-like [Ahaetulla prasina]